MATEEDAKNKILDAIVSTLDDEGNAQYKSGSVLAYAEAYAWLVFQNQPHGGGAKSA